MEPGTEQPEPVSSEQLVGFPVTLQEAARPDLAGVQLERLKDDAAVRELPEHTRG